ncbi:MAG: MlaD family protein [Treponema sp.]|jgi:phospholipid/cholesterol/gamma-HCH transport system substrate-binding protein|nr:MlaD family protein [Treponema sp.]
MKFTIRYADKIVGVLVILALAILIFVVFMLGTSQRWFKRDLQYKTYLTSASGLSPNMAVLYKGFTIGHVKKFSLSEDDKVEVLFTIFEEYKDRVKEGSVVEILISPIGLGNSFVFYPGKGKDTISERTAIPEINSAEGRRLVLERLVDRQESTSDAITVIVNQVRSILGELNIALSGAKGSEDTAIGKIVRNLEMTTEALSSQLSPIMGNLEAVTGQISSPSGTVMSFLDSEGPIYTDLTSSLNSLADIIENLNNISEFVPNQLPQVAILINDLSVALRSAQDVLTAASNNPLLRKGIPVRGETDPGGTNLRNLDF